MTPAHFYRLPKGLKKGFGRPDKMKSCRLNGDLCMVSMGSLPEHFIQSMSELINCIRTSNSILGEALHIKKRRERFLFRTLPKSTYKSAWWQVVLRSRPKLAIQKIHPCSFLKRVDNKIIDIEKTFDTPPKQAQVRLSGYRYPESFLCP